MSDRLPDADVPDHTALSVQPFKESQDCLGDGQMLRNRMREDGYLFFRGLVDPDLLLDLRRQVLEVCAAFGWLLDDNDLMQGRGRRGALSSALSRTGAYPEVQRLQDFHALAHSPAILDVLTAIVDKKVFPHPRNILRVTAPGNSKITTPPHQDYALIQGTPHFYTVWIPVGNCSLTLGGLSIARGSHQLGLLPVRSSEGAGGVAVDIDESTLDWCASDFHIGDVLIFNALTVHRALINTTRDRLRLSCDFRYQAVAEPIAWGSLEPHGRLMDWSEIYAGWDNERLKYYWQQYELQVVPSVSPFDCRLPDEEPK